MHLGSRLDNYCRFVNFTVSVLVCIIITFNKGYIPTHHHLHLLSLNFQIRIQTRILFFNSWLLWRRSGHRPDLTFDLAITLSFLLVFLYSFVSNIPNPLSDLVRMRYKLTEHLLRSSQFHLLLLFFNDWWLKYSEARVYVFV